MMKRIAALASAVSIATVLLTTSACQKRPSEDSDKSDKDAKVSEESMPESSLGFSRWVRASAAHYWSFMREPGELAEYARHTGIIAGDPHIANFSPIPVRLADGSEKLRYLNIDFDDAGRGPFALDFLRLVVTSKASQKRVKVKDMIDAYVAGLTGQPFEAPAEIDKLFDLGVYKERADKEIDEKSDRNGFKFAAGKVERYDGPITTAEIEPFLPGLRLIALARRPVEGGGSAGGLRLWILARDAQDARKLYELKEWKETSLLAFSAQPDLDEWLRDVQGVFWPGIDPTAYRLVTLSDGKRYWLREKKLTLIDPPYSSDSKRAVEYMRQLAEYDSFILGQAHGRQASAAPLAARIATEQGREAFRAAVKAVAARYLREAEARYKAGRSQ